MSRASSSVRTPRERKNRLSFSGRRPSSASNGSFQRVGIEASNLSGFGMATPRELTIHGNAAARLYSGGAPNFFRTFDDFTLFRKAPLGALDLRLVCAHHCGVFAFHSPTIGNSESHMFFLMK